MALAVYAGMAVAVGVQLERRRIARCFHVDSGSKWGKDPSRRWTSRG